MSVSSIRSYQDLEVWQMAMGLGEKCYLLTRKLPRDEMYGMSAQIRRAVASIPANIAEGFGREQTGPFIQFLRISQGSTRELETHLMLACRVKLLDEVDVSGALADCVRISKMLRSLIRSLESRS